MRLLFGILIIAEICLLAAPVVRFGVDSPDASRAWFEWRQNPNPETEQAWKAERARLRRENIAVDSALVGLLVANSLGLVSVGRSLRRKPDLANRLPPASEDGRPEELDSVKGKEA